jgi:hypothetical protein
MTETRTKHRLGSLLMLTVAMCLAVLAGAGCRSGGHGYHHYPASPPHYGPGWCH